MGCGLNKMIEKNRATGPEIKQECIIFKVSDLRKMKKRGLFIINEVNLSQECSSIKGMSGSYGSLARQMIQD